MSLSFTAFRALVRKDIATFLRDRRAVIVTVLTPIAIAAFFGYLFGGERTSVSRLPVAVVDEDGSALSRAVALDLASEEALAVEPTDRATAIERVRSGKLRAAIVLPRDFGAAATAALIGAAPRPPVELLYDPSQNLVRPIVGGLLTAHVMHQATRELMPGPSSAETPGSQATAASGLRVPFTLNSVAVSSGPRYNGFAHSFAGMSVQFILFMGIDAGVTLLLMREQGVWRRLRAAPVSRAVLLGSRLAGTTLIALMIFCAIYAAAMLIFGVRISGSVAGFAAVAVSFALLAASTGLMIAALGRSVAATRGVATFAVLLLVMLGGAWVPSFVFPDWLQHVALFVPTRWAVDGLDAMSWRGLPFTAVLAPVGVLLGCSILFALIAVWRFDWDAS